MRWIKLVLTTVFVVLLLVIIVMATGKMQEPKRGTMR